MLVFPMSMASSMAQARRRRNRALRDEPRHRLSSSPHGFERTVAPDCWARSALLAAIAVLRLRRLLAARLLRDGQPRTAARKGRWPSSSTSTPRPCRTRSGSLAQIIAAVLGIAITVVSIVVQLAANRYTSRVTDMFFRDRTNLAVMGFFVVSASRRCGSASASAGSTCPGDDAATSSWRRRACSCSSRTSPTCSTSSIPRRSSRASAQQTLRTALDAAEAGAPREREAARGTP